MTATISSWPSHVAYDDCDHRVIEDGALGRREYLKELSSLLLNPRLMV